MASNTSSSSSSSTTAAIPVNLELSVNNQSLVVLNVASQAPLKLTSTNYFPWRVQWDALLSAYDLYGFVKGTLPCPPSSSNYALIFWIRQDKFVLNGLLASITPEVSHLISSATTSATVWLTLANTFAKPSRPHLLRLKERLIKPQGNRSVTAYLLDVKTAADELAFLNHPIETDDLVLYIVNGLSPRLKDISAAIRTRPDAISFEDLHEQLVEHEAYLSRLEHQSETSVVTAHIANKNPSPSFSLLLP